MKTIVQQIFKSETEIKKSKFKVTIGHVVNKAAVEEFLATYSNPRASHNCYAYIYEDDQRFEYCHNDGEPSGTAGEPLLNLIKQNQLSNVIILVTRIFGGIKLGAGPLMRAYSNCANELLRTIPTEEWTLGYEFSISFSIENIKKVDAILHKYQVEPLKKFLNNINYIFSYINYEIIDSLAPFIEINYIINKFVSQV